MDHKNDKTLVRFHVGQANHYLAKQNEEGFFEHFDRAVTLSKELALSSELGQLYGKKLNDGAWLFFVYVKAENFVFSFSTEGKETPVGVIRPWPTHVSYNERQNARKRYAHIFNTFFDLLLISEDKEVRHVMENNVAELRQMNS